jgi:hypothetical protein
MAILREGIGGSELPGSIVPLSDSDGRQRKRPDLLERACCCSALVKSRVVGEGAKARSWSETASPCRTRAFHVENVPAD